MLKATQIKGNGSSRNSKDFLKYLMQNEGTDYYTDRSETGLQMSRFHGGGSALFGLTGTVQNDVLKNLAMGFGPDGEPLCQNAGSVKRKMGYDLTFSAPKSVSILFAQSDEETRKRILEIQQRAVGEAFRYIEQQAFTRRGKTGSETAETVPCRLIGMEINHFDNRNLEPMMHSHLFVPNLAVDEKGHWSTFDNKVLMEMQGSAGAIYRAELAKGLQQELNVGIEKQVYLNKKNQETGIYFGVSGIDKDTEQFFSSRRAEVLEYIEKHGVSSDIACKNTRKAKQEDMNYEELSANWKTLFSQLPDHPTLADLQKQSNNTGLISDQELLDKMHKTEAVFNRNALLERVANEYVGILDFKGIEAKVDALLESELIVQLKKDSQGRPQYTSQKMLDMEQSIIDSAARRKEDASVRLTREQVEAAITSFEKQKNATLTQEQRMAVEWVCMQTGGTACLSGMAGTGKTFSSLAYIHAYQSQGYQAIGVAVASLAAKKLQQDAGVPCYNAMQLESMLDNNQLKITPKTLIILDEAGMAGAQTISRLQKRCDAVGAKLVLMGDALQLQPVEASGAFSLAIQTVSDAKLSGIQRQHFIEDRVTASMFYGLDEKVIRTFWEKTYERDSLIVMSQLPETFTQAQFEQQMKSIRGLGFHHALEYAKLEVIEGEPTLYRSTQPFSRIAELTQEIEILDTQRIQEAMTDMGAQGAYIFDRLQERGQAKQFENDQASLDALLTDYYASQEPIDEKMVIAGTQKQVGLLNDAIHQRLKSEGVLGQGHVLKMTQTDWTEIDTEFCVGERIKFTEKDKFDPKTKKQLMNVANGDEGIITAIEPDDKGDFNLTVTITSEKEPRSITFNTSHYKDFKHNYAMTVHAGQGQGKNNVFWLCGAGMTDRHLALVAFTRTKNAFRLYGTEEDFELLGDKLAKTQLKTNAVSLCRSEEEKRLTQERELGQRLDFKEGIQHMLKSATSGLKGAFGRWMGKHPTRTDAEIVKTEPTRYDINLMLAREVEHPNVEERHMMVSRYVERKADVNALATDGERILYKAVKQNDVALVEYLMEHGADPRLPNADGKTISDLMKQSMTGPDRYVYDNAGYIEKPGFTPLYYVDVIQNGKKQRLTGQRLKKAIKMSGATLGDTIRLEKLGVKQGKEAMRYDYEIEKIVQIKGEVERVIDKRMHQLEQDRIPLPQQEKSTRFQDIMQQRQNQIVLEHRQQREQQKAIPSPTPIRTPEIRVREEDGPQMSM